jgi:hypothetical protein
LKQLPTVLPGWIVSLDVGLNQVNHGLCTRVYDLVYKGV